MSTSTAPVQKLWNYYILRNVGLTYGVAAVDRRLSVEKDLKSVVSANFEHATRLRQSILKKDFTGEP